MRNFIFFIKSLKSEKKKLVQLRFIMSVDKYGWAIQKSLFAQSSQDSTFSQNCENSKIFNVASKYFSFFKGKPRAS